MLGQKIVQLCGTFALVMSGVSSASLDVTTAEVDQVLNGRGMAAVKYAGVTVNVDSLYTIHQECQKCDESSSCVHKTLTGQWQCSQPSSRLINGQAANFCSGQATCCGGSCYNSVLTSCSYRNSDINTASSNWNMKSALDMMAILGDASSSEYDQLTSKMLTDKSTFATRCITGCNGWTKDGLIANVFCPTSCQCTQQTPAKKTAGKIYSCELPSQDSSLFASGDTSLTKSAQYGVNQNKVVCPKDYKCQVPDACLTLEAYNSLPAPTNQAQAKPSTTQNQTESASSGNNTGRNVGIGVGCGVAAVLAIGAAVFFIRKKKMVDTAEPDQTHYEQLM